MIAASPPPQRPPLSPVPDDHLPAPLTAVMDEAVPLSGSVLMVSGRVSFELVQKAAVAGLPLLCAVSAPSSLAVETAERVGMTVIGFLRDGGFNVYTGQDRIALDR